MATSNSSGSGNSKGGDSSSMGEGRGTAAAAVMERVVALQAGAAWRRKVQTFPNSVYSMSSSTAISTWN